MVMTTRKSNNYVLRYGLFTDQASWVHIVLESIEPILDGDLPDIPHKGTNIAFHFEWLWFRSDYHYRNRIDSLPNGDSSIYFELSKVEDSRVGYHAVVKTKHHGQECVSTIWLQIQS